MNRIYDLLLEDHFQNNPQMAFLTGPRQVGKTTLLTHAQTLSPYYRYLNWDILRDREIILAGPTQVTNNLPIDALTSQKPIVAFDEIHKYGRWKSYLKGFIDEFRGRINTVVTGSAQLNVAHRAGEDSLMGRYFLYRIHPLSVGELVREGMPKDLYSDPAEISLEKFNQLFEFGGFPEPFLKADTRFHIRWQNLRQAQLFREDVRELTQINELAQFEVLGLVIKQLAGQQLNYNHCAEKVRVSNPTIRRWMDALENLYYCFTIRPYSKNIIRSLLKEPKVYLWDWSVIEDKGARIENFVASHLLKAVHFWTDMGYGNFNLYYLRDKDQRECDFLITQNEKPWILMEVKKSGTERLSQNLSHFQAQLQVQHVFQLAFDLPYIEQDCFKLKTPKVVPLQTFLSQLI